MESLFTIERLMHYLNLKKSQIDYLVKNGLIPHFEIPNGEVLFRASDVEAWLESYMMPNGNKKLQKIIEKSRRCKKREREKE